MYNEGESLLTGIYIRVSTEEQAKEGFSINAQKEKLKQYAFARGWDIYDFYIDDGVSGKDLEGREQVKRLIKDVESGKINNVLVYKIDRLTRSVKNLMELIELFDKKDCAFNSVMESIDTSTATGRMFIKIVGIFAEFERENLAERVSFGYEQKVREGNYINTRGVYGYDYGENTSDLTVNQEEAALVRRIFDLYLKGESMSAIAKKMLEGQVPTKLGGRWRESTIKSILTNPLYIGKIRYGTTNPKTSFTVDSRYEPIVTEEIFNRAQAIYENRRKNPRKYYPGENTYFLTFLKCAECGSIIRTNQHRDKTTDNLYVNYSCGKNKEGLCSCRGFSHPKLEQAFQEYIAGLTDVPFESGVLDRPLEETEAEKRAAVQRRIDQNVRRMAEIRNLFTQDKLSFEEYREFSGTLSVQASELAAELERLAPVVQEEMDAEAVKAIIVNLQENWAILTNAEKKEFLTMFVESITVYSADRKVTVRDIRFNNGKPKEQEKGTAKRKRLVHP